MTAFDLHIQWSPNQGTLIIQQCCISSFEDWINSSKPTTIFLLPINLYVFSSILVHHPALIPPNYYSGRNWGTHSIGWTSIQTPLSFRNYDWRGVQQSFGKTPHHDSGDWNDMAIILLPFKRHCWWIPCTWGVEMHRTTISSSQSTLLPWILQSHRFIHLEIERPSIERGWGCIVECSWIGNQGETCFIEHSCWWALSFECWIHSLFGPTWCLWFPPSWQGIYHFKWEENPFASSPTWVSSFQIYLTSSALGYLVGDDQLGVST